jgi:L-ascorbate metabolism protein UlaG (beta-lactamase superfamily)
MKISFKWIGGATWILRFDNIKIACDPVLCPQGHMQDYKYFKTSRLNDPVYNESDFKDINLWLVTHNHEDHIDSFGFKFIQKNTTVVSHKGCRRYFKNDSFNDVRYLNWNDEEILSIDDINIRIKALTAIHAKRKIFASTVGNGNGYLLEIIKKDFNYIVYITGDSVYDKSIRNHIGNIKPDLIIANAGSAKIGKSLLSLIIGRITNNIHDILRMNRDLIPGKLIPVHWGTFSHYTEIITNETFNKYDNIIFIIPGESLSF